MKSAWNKRAKHDPFYYVETKHWDGDVDAFFKLGEERAGVLLKPVLDQLAIDTTKATALDLGCGIGRFSRVLAKSFRQVLAVDVSDEMIAQAREQNSAFSNISFLPTDGLTLPVGSATVDFVWSYEVFQHMPTHKVIWQSVSEVSRVLKVGGFAYLHFRTGASRRFSIPSWALRMASLVRRRDHLTSDQTWRGAPPLDTAQLGGQCRNVGLTLLSFHEDPTHAPGTRIFALLRK